MDEFKNNKDGKIEQLKVRQVIAGFPSPSDRKAVELNFFFPGQHIEAEIGFAETRCDCQDSTKRTADRDARIRCVWAPLCSFFGRWLVDRITLAEQNDGDIAGEKENLEEAKAGIAKLHKELDKLGDEVAASEVAYS